MSLHTEALSMDLLEQVLSRLGLADRPAPTLDGLHTPYAAWCREVPFDLEFQRITCTIVDTICHQC
jgi:hypothetical protein